MRIVHYVIAIIISLLIVYSIIYLLLAIIFLDPFWPKILLNETVIGDIYRFFAISSAIWWIIQASKHLSYILEEEE